MTTTPYSTLSALSPLDGRYAGKTDLLRPILSESGFMHHRVKVEISWLQALSLAGFAEIKPFSAAGTALAFSFASRRPTPIGEKPPSARSAISAREASTFSAFLFTVMPLT